MNKIKSLWNKVRQTPIFKAFIIWIVVVIVLVFMVDKLLMPAFAGAFARTGEVPNLEGLSEQAAESALTKAGFKFEWNEGPLQFADSCGHGACADAQGRSHGKDWAHGETHEESWTSQGGDS
ncbi:MAG: PASTA domain-containing protein [Fibrobacter sp.]|nr:PASTA domain-containing protein [Fibrobacter sp.]